jgi:replicative DNA helicase
MGAHIPPHNLDAERAILGSVLLDGRRAMDIVTGWALSATDFYTEAHRTVYATLQQLEALDRPLDLITVAEQLGAKLPAVGGAPGLALLIEQAAIAAHLDAYVQIVLEAAKKRALIQAATTTAAAAYNGRPADELLGELGQALDRITRRTRHEDYDPAVHWRSVVQAWDKSTLKVRLPALDTMTGGIGRGDVLAVAGYTSDGKALSLNTPLPTPEGWTTMGAVRPGDKLFGVDGRPVDVLYASPVMVSRPCYEVVFADRSSIIADADHRWLTWSQAARNSARRIAGRVRRVPRNDQRHKAIRPAVVTTEQIAASLRETSGRLNHSVTVCGSLQLPDASLPIDPYVLGVWLGDGRTSDGVFYTNDPEVVLAVEACGQVVRRRPQPYTYSLPGLKVRLRELGVLGRKHIPDRYLRASEAQRRALLAGLLDTDGTVGVNGHVGLDLTAWGLADGAFELMCTLGYRPTMSERRVRGKSEASSICYRIQFATDDKVFRLPRKARTHAERRLARPSRRPTDQRMVVAVRPVASVPVRCVEVSASDGLYLAGPSFVPTHNTAFAVNRAKAMGAAGVRVELLTLEERVEGVLRRMAADLAGVPTYRLRDGSCSPDEFRRAEQAISALQELPVTVQGVESLRSLDERAILSAVSLSRAEVVIIDHVQKVQVRRQGREDLHTYALGRLLDRLHAIALRDGKVVWLNCQLAKQMSRRQGPPVLSDIADSAAIERTARQAWLLYWPARHQAKEGKEPPERYVIYVAKNSEGGTGKVELRWLPEFGRFEDPAEVPF